MALSIDSMNYALLRPAYQSSIRSGGHEAGKAVDGNATTISHTLNGDLRPWWKVKLANPIWFNNVEINNREHKGKYNIKSS